MAARANLLGQVFGDLTVQAEAPSSSGHARWVCLCVCGNKSVVRTNALNSGATQSCGCGTRAGASRTHKKHGLNKSKEHRIWVYMRQRCQNPNNPAYAEYGGRGITVSPEWETFETFLADMGLRPSNRHSIDRIDNNGNYEKSNCRWADYLVQANNTRRNWMVSYSGKTMTVAEAIRASGTSLDRNKVYQRLRRGWSIDSALMAAPISVVSSWVF